MTANDPLERRIADHYAAEIPHRAPARVLDAALAVIDTTPQRRVFLPAPWRFPTMTGFAKVAVAAVAVIAIGALGLAIFRPGSAPGVGAQPSPSPTVSPSPDPSAPPPLSSTFTSTVHGISISYPTGWVKDPATQPWTQAVGINFHSSALDVAYDPALKDHLFLAFASQPLGGTTGEAWMTAFLADPEEGCGSAATEPITIDGATGRICEGLAAVAAGGRGYHIRMYASDDESWVSRYYDRAWFRSVLDTVQLQPEDAVSPTSSGSPVATPS
jgi:hypothetical protein